MDKSTDMIEFQNVKQLYNRLLPALRTKKSEMNRVGIDYVQEEDIWNYIKEIKWKKANNLSLYEMVNDVLNTDNSLIENYIKNKLKSKKTKPNLEEIE